MAETNPAAEKVISQLEQILDKISDPLPEKLDNENVPPEVGDEEEDAEKVPQTTASVRQEALVSLYQVLKIEENVPWTKDTQIIRIMKLVLAEESQEAFCVLLALRILLQISADEDVRSGFMNEELGRVLGEVLKAKPLVFAQEEATGAAEGSESGAETENPEKTIEDEDAPQTNEIELSALNLLTQLATVEANRPKLVFQNVAQALLKVVKSREDDELRLQSLKILNTLSMADDSTKMKIIEQGALRPCVAVVKNELEKEKQQAAAAAAKRKKYRKRTSIPLVETLSLLGNLSSPDTTRISMISAKVPQALIQAVEEDEKQARVEALQGLSNLAKHATKCHRVASAFDKSSIFLRLHAALEAN